jgi:hypothetical protein
MPLFHFNLPFSCFCIYPQVAIIDIFTEGLCFFPNIYWYLCRDVEREAEAAARGAGVPAILDPGRRVLGQLRRDQLRDNMPHGRRRLRWATGIMNCLNLRL